MCLQVYNSWALRSECRDTAGPVYYVHIGVSRDVLCSTTRYRFDLRIYRQYIFTIKSKDAVSGVTHQYNYWETATANDLTSQPTNSIFISPC